MISLSAGASSICDLVNNCERDLKFYGAVH